MEGASVVATSILNSHPSDGAMLEHFAENLTRTQEYYESHDPNATVAATEMATTTPPNMPLSRLAQMLLTVSPNLTDNPTHYPYLPDILEATTFTVTTASNGAVNTHAPEFTNSTLVKVCVLAMMALLSLFGNLIAMWNIYKTRLKRRSLRNSWNAIYSLLFHLSIADLLVTGFCIIGEAAWAYTVQWRGGDLLCKTFKLFQMFSLYLSTYVMVLIGVDRWFAVKFPMRSLYMTKRCYHFLGIVYILSLVLSIPQFYIFHLSRGPFIEEFHQCVTHGTYTAQWQEQSYTTFTLFSTFLIPFCVLTITYISTFRAISKSEKMFLGPQQEPHMSANLMHTNRQRLIHKAKMNSLRLSFVIIIAFLICWAPYCTLMVLLQFAKIKEATSDKLIDIIFFFGMSNSLVNPVIYWFLHPRTNKSSAKSGNGGYSLNRADSQRNPSMLTAVTQIDGSDRSTRINRQPSYYRAQHNVSNSKEQASLLQMTPTTAIVHKFNSNSERSSVGSSPQTCSTNFTRSELGDHEHESGCEGGGGGGGGGGKRDANSHSTVVYSFKKPSSLRAKSFEALAIFPPNNRMQAPKAASPVSENGFHRSVCVLSLEDCNICADEHVSDV